MIKFRKAFAAGMIAMMCLTACGSSTSNTGAADKASDAASASGTAGSAYNMSYIATVEDEWLTELMNDMSVSAKNNDVNMEIMHAGNDSSKVIQCIDQAKAEGKDAVIVNVAYSNDARACVEAAGDMNLVFVNRLPEASDYDLLGENIVGIASD